MTSQSEKAEIFAVLDDHKEMMKGRQKELNLLKDMGAMTVVTRSKAVGKRWADPEKDGCVKSRLVLKDFNRSQGCTQPEMFSPTPSTLSLKTMLAASSHDRTIIQNAITSQLHLTYTQHSCTLTLTKSYLQSTMNQSCAKTKCGN